jgi:hypothetical protein
MPITLTCPGCAKIFHLRDEMAGRKVRCPECETIQVVPALFPDEVALTLDTDEATDGLHAAFDRERFLFRQKLMTLSEKYVVWDDRERPILFIERPAYFWRQVLGALATIVVLVASVAVSGAIGVLLSQHVEPSWIGAVVFALLLCGSLFLTVVAAIALSPKRHISFYADESKGEVLLKVLQDKKFQPVVATYTVVTPEGETLGRMKKNYLYNFFRKKWEVLNSEGYTVLVAREDSLLLSLLRRVLGPMFGFLRTNFILVVPGADGLETIRGEFNRKFTVFDRYVLDLTRDRPRTIDRRLAVALGVLLDTGEHR